MTTIIGTWQGGTPKHVIKFIRSETGSVIAKIQKEFIKHNEDGTTNSELKEIGTLGPRAIAVDKYSTAELLRGASQVTVGISQLTPGQQEMLLRNVKNLGVEIANLPDRVTAIRLFRFS